MLAYYLVLLIVTLIIMYFELALVRFVWRMVRWMRMGYTPAEVFRIFFKAELAWAFQPWTWYHYRRKHWEEEE